MTCLHLFQQAQEAPLGDFTRVRDSLPWLGATLAPLLLALFAPHGSPSVRRTFAVVLALAALGLGVFGVLHRGEWASLDVVNPFFDLQAGRPRIHVVDRVQAPFWHWCAAAAGLVLLPALALLAGAKGKPGAPQPVLRGALLGAWYIAARLVLEHFAAPMPVVWATGIVFALLLILPFVGFWCGRRGASWKGWIAQLFLLGLAHRVVVAALGYWLTTKHLGTHLDVHTVESAKLPLSGLVTFTSDTDRWLRLIAIPQLALWVPATVLLGLVLGALPYAAGRRR